MRYSKNEPINLILSSYVSRARENGIDIEINISATKFERFQTTDLCSLLANALENAIKACVQMKIQDDRYIKLRMYEKSNKLCLDIRNSYEFKPLFKQGVPVSHHSNHGIGIKSIIHVVEKHQGIYRFSAEDGIFTFQMSM